MPSNDRSSLMSGLNTPVPSVPTALRLALAVVAAISLSGCFDMKQALTVADDGSSTMTLEISVDAAILAMGSQDKSDNFCQEPPGERQGVAFKSTRTTERGDVVCFLEMSGTLDAIAAMIQSGKTLPGLGEGAATADAASESTMTLTKEGENYRFDVAMPMNMAPKSDDSGFDPTPMMAAMFAGRSLSFSVTAPEIIETSGTISDDKTTASYDYPLALSLQEGASGAEFSVVFSPGRSKFLGIF